MSSTAKNQVHGAFTLIITLVLIIGLLPVLPSVSQDAYAETTSWNGTDSVSATITGLVAGDQVALYQIAKTTKNANNTLTSVWVSAGNTTGGTSWNTVSGDTLATDITIDKYQTDYANSQKTSGTEGYDATSWPSDVNSIVSYVKSHTGSFTPSSTVEASGSDSNYSATFGNVTAGLYVVLVTNSNNKTRMYQNKILAVDPAAQTDGTWALSAVSESVKSSAVSVKKYAEDDEYLNYSSNTDKEDFGVSDLPFYDPTLKKHPRDFRIATGGGSKYVNTVMVGDKVAFQLQAVVPDYSSVSTGRTFTLTDTLPAGLTLVDPTTDSTVQASSLTVWYADEASRAASIPSDSWNQLTKDSDYTLGISDSSSTTGAKDITITISNPTVLAGKCIYVTYQATVNDNAATVMKNTSTVTFSTDDQGTGTGSTETTEVTTKATATVYTMQLVMNKYAEDGSTPLAGATFKLYPVYYYDSGGEYSVGPYPDQVLTETTDSTGSVVFKGLLFDQVESIMQDHYLDHKSVVGYILEEASAPAGYSAINCIYFFNDTSPGSMGLYGTSSGFASAEDVTSTEIGDVFDYKNLWGPVVTDPQEEDPLLSTSSDVANSDGGTSTYTASIPSGFCFYDGDYDLIATTSFVLTISISDKPSTKGILPATGGTGTVALTVTGVVIMAGAALLLVRSRRKKQPAIK